MPEREFDLYLSLLSRFLKLNPSQRGEISDELRTHLEDRLEELAARGLSREQAIHTALEELGDAAELAQHFTRAAHIRRRRFIMRCTYGTVAALVAALLVGTAFWPQTPNGNLPPQAVAENAIAAVAADDQPRPAPATRDDDDARNAELEARLDVPINVAFHETPLEDALRYIRDTHKVHIHLDRPTLVDEGISADAPINLELSGFNLRTVFELALEPLQLTYVLRDGLLFVTTRAKADEFDELRVYDIRDLVVADAPGKDVTLAEAGAHTGGGRGKRDEPLPASAFMFSSTAGYKTTSIARVVTATIYPESWLEHGGSGSIVEYNGMLVVKQTHPVHHKIKKLLEMMRRSRKQSQDNPRRLQASAATNEKTQTSD